MPIYTYQATSDDGCAYCRDGFDARHGFSETVAECPQCAADVRPVLSSFAIGKSTAQAMKTLQKAGWTQYDRAGKGAYEKTAGVGPDTLGED